MLNDETKQNSETLDYFNYIKGMFSSNESNISENVEEIVAEEILKKAMKNEQIS